MVLGAVTGFAASAAVLVAYADHLSVTAVADSFATRFLGLGGDPLPGRLQLLSAAITALGVASVSLIVWLLLRPRAAAPHDQARDRMTQTIATLERMNRPHGFFVNDIDPRDGEHLLVSPVDASPTTLSPGALSTSTRNEPRSSA